MLWYWVADFKSQRTLLGWHTAYLWLYLYFWQSINTIIWWRLFLVENGLTTNLRLNNLIFKNILVNDTEVESECVYIYMFYNHVRCIYNRLFRLFVYAPAKLLLPASFVFVYESILQMTSVCVLPIVCFLRVYILSFLWYYFVLSEDVHLVHISREVETKARYVKFTGVLSLSSAFLVFNVSQNMFSQCLSTHASIII